VQKFGSHSRVENGTAALLLSVWRFHWPAQPAPAPECLAAITSKSFCSLRDQYDTSRTTTASSNCQAGVSARGFPAESMTELLRYPAPEHPALRRNIEMRTMITALMAVPVFPQAPPQKGDLPEYGRNPGGARYSALTQMNTGNVSRLRRAWASHTGEPGRSLRNNSHHGGQRPVFLHAESERRCS
jgi:hypothetical protein